MGAENDLVQLRETTTSDHAGVMALFARHGMTVVPEPRWNAWWSENPARRAGDPTGWVLVSGAGIAGHIGNLPRLMWDGTRAITAHVPASWVVDEGARAYSMSLLTQWLRQPGTELLLNTTANAQAAALFDRLRIARVPCPELDRRWIWVVAHAPLARALMRSRGLGAVTFLAGLVTPLDARPSRSGMRGVPVVSWRPDFDASFDRLWEHLATRPVLQSVRDSRHLRWAYAAGLHTGATWLAVEPDGGELRGYAVFRRRDIVTLALPRVELVEFASLDDDPTPFVNAAIERARREGIPVLETSGFHGPVAARLARLGAWQAKRAGWPSFWRAADPTLTTRLQSAAGWYTTPYDGDSSLA